MLVSVKIVEFEELNRKVLNIKDQISCLEDELRELKLACDYMRFELSSNEKVEKN